MKRALTFALVIAGASGCDPRDFDAALDRAPVRSLKAPDGYKAPDVGRVLLPLTVPAGKAGVAARFLVAGTQMPSIAVVDLDPQGKPTISVAKEAEIIELSRTSNAPLKGAFELADGRILFGAPNFGADPKTQTPPKGRVGVLKLNEAAKGVTFELRLLDDPGARKRFGVAVAAGRISGAADEDFVALSDDEAFLLEDGKLETIMPASSSCDLRVADENYFRSIAVGDLVDGEGDEVAVGVPRDNATGKVYLMRKEAGKFDCPVVLESPAPEGRARFGAALAAGDFDGDGRKDDLLVGAPPNRAYLFLGPFQAGMAPKLELTLQPPAGTTPADFGFKVLAADVDGVAGVELLVTAPGATVGGTAEAGQVFVFRRDGTELAQLRENDPTVRAGFGFSVGAVKFSPGACAAGERHLVTVGAIEEVFTYFKLPQGPADPRCFAPGK